MRIRTIMGKIINNDNDSTSKHSLYWNLSESEARDLCRHQLDAMEHWARRLIDETFKKSYADDYFNFKTSNGALLLKKEMRDRIEGRINDDPIRFPRKIDAIVIEDLVYFFCKEDFYRNHFKDVFEPFYSGVSEVRSVIERISKIRNKISHGNHISQHEIEQCVCYTNDFIDVFREYYKKIGREKEYNVPTFLVAKDCLGNCVVRKESSVNWEIRSWKISPDGKAKVLQLRSGDSYRLELEVDSSFSEDFYEIKWCVYLGISPSDCIARGKGKTIEFTVNDEAVSLSPTIFVALTTKRSWHRSGYSKCDDVVYVYLDPVLPPIEDTY